MRDLNLRPPGPITGGGGKTNTAKKNKDGTVTLNNSAVLTKEGQEAIFDTEYKYNEGQPYLGKYGDYYSGAENRRTKGANVASFKDGYVSFKDKQYNDVAQQRIMDEMRAYPQNKGREFYLKDSQKNKYKSPSGYQYNKTQVNPLKSVR